MRGRARSGYRPVSDVTVPHVVYLLDTNVFREVQKGGAGHVNVRRWLAGVDDADLRLSVMTVREVRRGIARLAKRKPGAAAEIEERFEELLAAYAGRVVEIDGPVAEEWGRLEGERTSTGLTSRSWRRRGSGGWSSQRGTWTT